MSNIWFTSDTHIGHKRILEYCPRPFKTVEEMNEGLVERWNGVVKDEDTVYHLGDVALCPKEIWQPVTQRLNGHKILIKGNHDKHTNKSYYEGGFEKIHDRWELKLPQIMCAPVNIYLEHRPKFDYDQEKFQLHFCGHIHQRWTRKQDIINVGVDVWNYTPVSYYDLVKSVEDYKEPEEGLHAMRDKGYYDGR